MSTIGLFSGSLQAASQIARDSVMNVSITMLGPNHHTWQAPSHWQHPSVPLRLPLAITCGQSTRMQAHTPNTLSSAAGPYQDIMLPTALLNLGLSSADCLVPAETLIMTLRVNPLLPSQRAVQLPNVCGPGGAQQAMTCPGKQAVHSFPLPHSEGVDSEMHRVLGWGNPQALPGSTLRQGGCTCQYTVAHPSAHAKDTKDTLP